MAYSGYGDSYVTEFSALGCDSWVDFSIFFFLKFSRESDGKSVEREKR